MLGMYALLTPPPKNVAILHTYMYVCMCACMYVSRAAQMAGIYALLKLIAFELAGEDRDRRENPVLSRLKIAFFALHKRG